MKQEIEKLGYYISSREGNILAFKEKTFQCELERKGKKYRVRNAQLPEKEYWFTSKPEELKAQIEDYTSSLEFFQIYHPSYPSDVRAESYLFLKLQKAGFISNFDTFVEKFGDRDIATVLLNVEKGKANPITYKDKYRYINHGEFPTGEHQQMATAILSSIYMEYISLTANAIKRMETLEKELGGQISFEGKMVSEANFLKVNEKPLKEGMIELLENLLNKVKKNEI